MSGAAKGDDLDGGIYAEGRMVGIRPLKTATGVTLGGHIAKADTPQMAMEIARRCGASDAMREALAAAAVQFASYAAQHRAKGTADGDAKALTNEDMAARMRAAIDKGDGAGAP